MVILILHFFALVGAFHFLMILYAKHYKCNLSEAHERMLHNLYDGIKEVFSVKTVNTPLILNHFEAAEHTKSITRFCESAVFVKSGCDGDFFEMCFEVAGIKDKFQDDLEITKRALVIDLQRYYQRLRQLEYQPVVVCTSFMEGQLTFKVALTENAVKLLHNKAVIREDIKNEK